MASLLRYSAVAALVSSAAGIVIGAAPSPTVPGLGDNFSPAPTKAPELELVKAKLAKKAVTNICDEWTILGGYGQPECFNSETCLFYSTTLSGTEYNYEGCGQTSIKYNWITECWDYGEQTGSVPTSQIYCPATAPSCGFFAFVFEADYTFYNYGCSTSSYALYVELLATETDNGTISSSVSLQTAVTSGGAATATAAPTNAQVITVTSTANSGSATSASSVPTIGSHSTSSTPTGAIAGGAVGGVAVLAIVGFLIFWFCLRGRSQKKANAASNAQMQQGPHAGGNYQPPINHVPEIAGTAKPGVASPPAPVGYAEKPAHEYTQNPSYAADPRMSAQSPPPTYSGANEQQQQNGQQYSPQQHAQQYPPHAQQYPTQPQQYPPQPQHAPSPLAPSPNNQYSELAHEHGATMDPRASTQPPVSPASTTMYTQSPPQRASELMGGGSYQNSPPQHVNELGGGSRGSYQVQSQAQEMSGASTGGISRPTGQGARPVQYDMSGNPMNEVYRTHEME